MRPNRRILVLRDTKVSCRDIVEVEFQDWADDPNSRIRTIEKAHGKLREKLKESEITQEEHDSLFAEIMTYDEAYGLIDDENLIQCFKDINKTKAKWTLYNGSTIIFTGADNKKQIIGKENHLVWVNEPYEFPEKIMKQLIKRVTGHLLIDWNPSEDLYIEKYKSRPDCKVIHSTFRDNPFLDETVRDELLGNKPLLNKHFDFPVEDLIHSTPKVFVPQLEAKSIGQEVIDEIVMCWNNEKNLTADSYEWDVYGLGLKAERPNRIFRWTEIPLSEYLRLGEVPTIHAADWGQVDPFGILEMKYYDGALYLHEKNYASENKIRKEMTDHDKMLVDDNIKEGLVIWLFKKLNINKQSVIVCDSNRSEKIISLRRAGYERAIACKKPPGSIINGIGTLLNMKVYYTHTSKNIKMEQEKYSRKTDRFGTILEEPEDINNHLMDATRYGVKYWQLKGLIKTV